MTALADLLGPSVEPWHVHTALVLLATLLVDLLTRALLRRTQTIALKTASAWDDVLVQAGGGPLLGAVWTLGLFEAAELTQVGADRLDPIRPARDVALVLCLAWLLLRLIRKLTEQVLAAHAGQPEGPDTTTVDAISKLARLVVVGVALLTAAQTMGLSVSGLLAAGGIGGVAVGFAAKDLLANFFGGLTIYLDRPFAVGDWVRSPDRDIEGTVEHISWRHTRIRRFNKNPLYVPNAAFTTIAVENPSRMSHRRIKLVLGLRYKDAGRVPAIVEDLRAALVAHPEVDTTQPTIVNLDALGASSLDIVIHTFTCTTDWVRYHALRQELLLTMLAIVDQHGASLAWPTHTIYQEEPDGTGDLPPRPPARP
jgi:MscS family membrane protein